MKRGSRHAGEPPGHAGEPRGGARLFAAGIRRLARVLEGPGASVGSVAVLLVLAIVALSPAGTSADADVEALTESVPLSASSFDGTPAVGALLQGGPHGSHFCTASVVPSRAQDLIVTAAHCVSGFASDPGAVTFVPGYHNGRASFGTWTVTGIFTGQGWQSDADQDDDVAFLTVRGPVQRYTGAEQLASARETLSTTGRRAGAVIRVIGYPDGQGVPVTCQNHVTMISATQMEFDCKGFTDGTSGGPFLTGIHSATGTGTVVGVVGGYQQGGYTPDVSYSPTFGPDVQVLYRSLAGRG